MELEPASKQMLAIEAKKLGGQDISSCLLRWARYCNMMSGAMVVLRGKPQSVTYEHCEEWLTRVAAIQSEVEKLAKKLRPKVKAKPKSKKRKV